jgi:hypothetical protein
MKTFLKHLASKREGSGTVKPGGAGGGTGGGGGDAGHKAKPASFITSTFLTPAAEGEISLI